MRLAQIRACGVSSRRHGLYRVYTGVYSTVPCRTTRRHDGVDCHRSPTLTSHDVTVVDGIPVTTVARTVLDLAAVVPRRQVERALDRAEALRVYDGRALRDQVARNPHHPGARILGAILTDHVAGSTETWSELEELCLEVSRAAGVPAPEVNAFVDPGDGEPPVRADFMWRAQRVIVKSDGFNQHGTRAAFERDRCRDQRLAAAGWQTIRVTWRQLRDERARIIALLVAMIRPA